MKQKIVLHLIQTLTRGGAERIALDIAKGLRKYEWETIIASDTGALLKEVQKNKIKYYQLNLGSRKQNPFNKNVRELIRIIRDNNVQIVHTHSHYTELPGLCAARWTRKPIVATFHGRHGIKKISKSLPLMLTNPVLRQMNKVVGNSKWTTQFAIKTHKLNPNKTTTIYNGIDTDLFNPDKINQKQKDELKQKWNIKNDDFVILIAARLDPWKGHKVAVDVAKDIIPKYPNAKFIFAGTTTIPKYQKELQEKIKQNGASENIQIVGDCEDIQTAMAVCDCVLSTSTLPETFGNTIVEAQAMKKPVIATNIGATGENMKTKGEYPKEQMTGWRIEPNNPKQLAETIEEIINTPKTQRQKIGERGREFVVENFSVDKMCENYANLYDKLSDPGGHGAHA